MKVLKYILPVLLAFSLSACIYSKGANVVQVANGTASPGKSGRSCISNVFGLVTWGDSSISSAAEDAGINQIASIEWFSEAWVLGLFARHCLIVTGN